MFRVGAPARSRRQTLNRPNPGRVAPTRPGDVFGRSIQRGPSGGRDGAFRYFMGHDGYLLGPAALGVVLSHAPAVVMIGVEKLRLGPPCGGACSKGLHHD